MLSGEIELRVMEICRYMVASGCTVRQAADVYGVSKSTVYKDCTERIRELDTSLSEQVREILERNLSVRHLRGGEATRRKYRSARKG